MSEKEIHSIWQGQNNKCYIAWTDGTSTRLPNINMKLNNDMTMTGWVPTQQDMCARDWKIVS